VPGHHAASVVEGQPNVGQESNQVRIFAGQSDIGRLRAL
jgi:hypothetical protein